LSIDDPKNKDVILVTKMTMTPLTLTTKNQDVNVVITFGWGSWGWHPQKDNWPRPVVQNFWVKSNDYYELLPTIKMNVLNVYVDISFQIIKKILVPVLTSTPIILCILSTTNLADKAAKVELSDDEQNRVHLDWGLQQSD
jgi:hypothetical protein